MGRKKVFYQKKRLQKKSLTVSNLKVSISFKILQSRSPSFSLLKKQLTACSLPEGWTTVETSRDVICICYLKCINNKSDIYYTVTVLPDFTFTIETFNHKIDKDVRRLDIPHLLQNKDTLVSTLKKIEKFEICPGNPDVEFIQFVHLRGDKLTNKRGNSIFWFFTTT